MSIVGFGLFRDQMWAGGPVVRCRVDVYSWVYQWNGTARSSDQSAVSGDGVGWGGTTVSTGGELECLSGFSLLRWI